MHGEQHAPCGRLFGAEKGSEPMKDYIRQNGLRILAALILLAMGLYSAVRLVHYAVSVFSTRRTNEELQAVFEAAEDIPTPTAPVMESMVPPTAAPEPQLLDSYQYMGDAILPKMQKLIDRNPDTVLWLHIPGGIVDLPVVYRDNTYYLDHEFYGKRSKSGTLFLDEQHPFLNDTQYLVIHGHNWFDGSMFGMLSHYIRKGYMEEHSTVHLYTLYRQEEYEVIGVLYVPADAQSDGYVPYVGMRKFQSQEQFQGFAELIRENALYWKEGAEMMPDDAYLALSTCYEDYRIVVMCRRISAG